MEYVGTVIKRYKREKMKDIKSPQFNAGLDYLWRIGDLLKILHQFGINEDWNSYFLTLCQIQGELMPRMTDDMILECRKCERECNNLFISKDLQSHIGRRALLRWYNHLSASAHRLGLIMPDAKGGLDAIQDGLV